MADDLDDLLDEVEIKFCRKSSAHPVESVTVDQNRSQQSERTSTADGGLRRQAPKGAGRSEIDDLLEEMLDDDHSHVSLDKTTAVLPGSKDPSPQLTRKCCPVFLGGSSIATGVGSSVSQRACSQLRCTSCDFRVAMFDDQEWDSSCDYLFFRNNMPEPQRLQARLRRRPGTRAYACQCSWHTARDLTDLSAGPRLKWVCSAHVA